MYSTTKYTQPTTTATHHHHHHHQQQQQQQQHTTPAASVENNRNNSGKSPVSNVPPNTLALVTKPNAAPRTAAASSITSEDYDPDYPDSRYECAICINWLDEPVITTCGHRFCKSCLNAWLLKNNHCCPLDNKQLSTEHDIFPDNCTRREIALLKFKCPNSPLGCSIIASPVEVDKHLPTCPYRRGEKCPFASIKCDFIGRPETNALEEHLKDDMPLHMQLMLQALQNMAVAPIGSNWNAEKPMSAQLNGGQLPAPPAQYANEADEQLIQSMHQRIVLLEQKALEQEFKIENLNKQLLAQRQLDARYSNGTIVWEVQNFCKLMEQLRASANNLLYSAECYTSPHGYKFCARLNVQPKKEELLSLHVHLMQSENDFHLEWPFKGRIKLVMVHPRDANLSQHDTIMTKPEILAFHRPRERISTRGFGFLEYANIADIMQRGFVVNDRLIIKIQINLV